MTSILQFVTLALLLGWPAYNIVIALLALKATGGEHSAVAPPDPDFWIMIPALNEAKVIANTVTAALALHTPETPVRVLVIDDGSDDDTPAILAAFKHPRLNVLRRRMPNARQGKGEALNAGYRAIRGSVRGSRAARSTIIGVVDGDGRGEFTLLQEVSSLFVDPAVGAVQCRVRIHNRDRILGLLQDIEFACVANASQSLRDRLDSVGLGGNGQFVRLSDLTRLGNSPWSSCLVEDLELGLKLHLAGVVIRYTSRGSMSQQAVVDLRRLLRQRARWAQGNLQCVRYLWPLSKSRHIGSLGLLDFLVYLVSPWLSIPTTLLVLTAMALAVVSLTTGNTFGGLMAGSTGIEEALTLWLGALLIPGLGWGTLHWWRIGDEPLHRCVLAGLCYPAYLVLGIAATWRGVARHVLGRMSWTKTERHDERPPRPAPALVDAVTTHMPGRGVQFQDSATVVVGPSLANRRGKAGTAAGARSGPPAP